MPVSAISIRFDEHSMWVDLTDGRTLGIPLAWSPRLLRASPAQREQVELTRVGLHWETIDEDISIASLLAGRPDDALSPLRDVRGWFEVFDAKEFDAAIERDAKAGKLDALAEEALAAHRAGRSREL
jgi:hypothetical protein